jgi:hypothetical protein
VTIFFFQIPVDDTTGRHSHTSHVTVRLPLEVCVIFIFSNEVQMRYVCNGMIIIIYIHSDLMIIFIGDGDKNQNEWGIFVYINIIYIY